MKDLSAGGISSPLSAPLTSGHRYLILVTVFLGWMFAGMEMALMVPTARPAIQDFLAAGQLAGHAGGDGVVTVETLADQWFSWLLVAFLLGAAVGGMVFGWLGDRVGRRRAMGWSILCYSVVTGLSYYVETPGQCSRCVFWLAPVPDSSH